MKYDLEERTARFGETIVELAKAVPKNTVTIPIISQLVRAGTSVGANYCEAIGASSRKDFRNKIYICRKEVQETKYWLRILSTAESKTKDEARKLWREAQELTLIFSKITSTMKAGLPLLVRDTSVSTVKCVSMRGTFFSNRINCLLLPLAFWSPQSTINFTFFT